MIAPPREQVSPVHRLWARWESAVPGLFLAVVAGLAGLWLFLLPYDATDLCYLLSLEDHVWVTQEVVHPLWVPLLWLYRFVLRAGGWRGFMLVPIEAANVVLSAATLVLFFRVSRRITKDALASACAALLLAACPAFSAAAMRSTPYALAFLCLSGSLMLLVGDAPASRRRYLVAGALAGVSMSLHASAMALAPAAVLCAALDPERKSWSSAAGKVAAYGAGMVTVAVAAWTGWLRFNGLGASFFRPAHLRSLFSGVEQVPGTSIYSSGSWWSQATGISATGLQQGAPLLVLGLVAVIVEVARARGPEGPKAPLDRRLLVAAGAIFAAVAGFFFINNTHNGFIYASLSLLPLVVARAGSRAPWARGLLAVTPFFAVPLAAVHSLGGMDRFHEPLPDEVRFVEKALGPRAVLLVPGCAFGELRLLSALHVFRVQIEPTDSRDCSLPRAEAGGVLRARVRAWQDEGVRVFLAYGDEERDFAGDANGEEKAVQLFWSPELAAKERAPKLRAVRASLVTAGLRLGEPFVSPHGARYGEVTAPGEAVAPPPAIAAGRFESAESHDVNAGVAQAALDRLHALAPHDPWAPCDAVCLGLTRPSPEGVASWDDQLRLVRSQCACPAMPDSSSRLGSPPDRGCHFGPHFDSAAAGAYIGPWAQRVGLGVPVDWSVRFDDDRAEVRLKLAAGTLGLTWRLLGSCEPGPVEMRPVGVPALSPAVAQDFAAHLPAPRLGGD
jgi:hypothetical protein